MCLEKKGKEKSQQTTTSTKVHLDEFATKFEGFSLVSCLSMNTITKSAWYVDNGASHHITEAWEWFSSLMKKESGIHVELGGDAKYVVKGEGTVQFMLKSRGTLEAKDMWYVLGMKKNLLLVSVMKDRRYIVMRRNGKLLIVQRIIA